MKTPQNCKKERTHLPINSPTSNVVNSVSSRNNNGLQNPTPYHRQSQTTKNYSIPPIRTAQKKQQGFKLYERRNNLKNSLMINTLIPNFLHNPGFSSCKTTILSPSLLDFPSLALSLVTPLNGEDPFDKSSLPSLKSSSEEEKAIVEKNFYLHPSSMTTPRNVEPQILPSFPMTSPRISDVKLREIHLGSHQFQGLLPDQERYCKRVLLQCERRIYGGYCCSVICLSS